MGGLYSAFGTDKKGETEGVWRELNVDNGNGTTPRFLLARMGRTNPGYYAKVEAVAKEFKTEINLDLFTDKQAEGPMLTIFAETILLGWENVYDDRTQTEVIYSKANVVKLMTDLPDLYDLLREWATKISGFRDTEIEKTAGE